ncbi:MAG: hypothetical protein JWO97_4132 [Acidobacteria bacterium]|nr:hypothetical protein [Acidobacteriota bacterium]
MRSKSSQGFSPLQRGTARRALLALLFAVAACRKPEALTAAKAEEIIKPFQFRAEPIYAEVPQKVWWNAKYPKDDFDEKSLKTFHNLEAAGLITITDISKDGTTSYVAKATAKGFPLLGTAPSMRGPAYRGRIAVKTYDGIRNFIRHPNEPTVGHAELIWHYDQPTALYPMFETKKNKELNKPYASLVAFYWKDGEWRFDVTVRKTEATE